MRVDERLIELLDLLFVHPWHERQAYVIESRMEALVDMLKLNTTILECGFNENEIYQESVIPYLETNWFRLRLVVMLVWWRHTRMRMRITIRLW
jgi:hypothetical protein